MTLSVVTAAIRCGSLINLVFCASDWAGAAVWSAVFIILFPVQLYFSLWRRKRQLRHSLFLFCTKPVSVAMKWVFRLEIDEKINPFLRDAHISISGHIGLVWQHSIGCRKMNGNSTAPIAVYTWGRVCCWIGTWLVEQWISKFKAYFWLHIRC